MKDEIAGLIDACKTYEESAALIDDWMDYYNNDRYQTLLHGMSPNEYYKYIKTNELPPAFKLL